MEEYKGKTIIFCLPGRQFSNNFLLSWTNLFSWCLSKGIRPLMVNRYSPNLYYVRNLCLGGDVTSGVKQKPYQGKVEYDYMMWIDSDVVFEPEHFEELLKVDQPIVSGLYMMQDNIHYATVESMDDEYFLYNGSYQFLRREDVKKKEEPFPVDYTGFGWVLIKKGVFEEFEYPWFRPMWTNLNRGGVAVSDFSMEDVAFCRMAQKKGYKIWIAPKAIVGHEKMMIL